MVKTVNIDWKDYLIRSCDSCPFYDNGDGGYGNHCQYPVNPAKSLSLYSETWKKVAEDCPLDDATGVPND